MKYQSPSQKPNTPQKSEFNWKKINIENISSRSSNKAEKLSFSIKQESNLLDSNSFLALKQNMKVGMLNGSLNLDKGMNQSRKQEYASHLQRRKRHHSEQLLREFTKELQSLQDDPESDEDVQEKIQRLESAVDKIKEAKMLFINPLRVNFKDMNQSERMFAENEIIDLYEFKLDEKDKELRDLKKILQEVQERSKMEKECEKNMLRRSLRNHLEEVYGPPSGIGSQESKKSLVGRDLFGAGSNSSSIYLPLSQLIEKEEGMKCSFQEEEMEERYKDLYCAEEIQMEVMELQEEKPQQFHQQRNNATPVDPGFITSRFGIEQEQELVLVVTSEEKFRKEISTIKLQEVIVAPSPFVKQRQTIRVSVSVQTQNYYSDLCTQTPMQLIEPNQKDFKNRLRAQTAQTETQTVINESEQSEQISAEISFSKPATATTLTQDLNVINLVVQPESLQCKKNLQIYQQFSFSLNNNLIGSRLRTYKSLTKVVIELLTSAWHMISKAEKKSHSSPTRRSLVTVSDKITKFIKNFNQNYTTIKNSQNSHMAPEEFYTRNVKELREIEEHLVSLLRARIC